MFKKYYQADIFMEGLIDNEALFAYCSGAGINYSVFEKPDSAVIYVYGVDTFITQKHAASICSAFNGILQGIKLIDEEQYLLKYLDDFKPFTIGRLDIVPYFHDSYTTDRQKLIMDPGYAFGTGEHQSTKLELLFMQDMDFTGRKVLDLGTGSGILAVYASIAGASEITAIDTDDSSMYAGPRNAELNDADNIEFVIGDINVLKDNTKYDIVLLNMLPSNFMPFFHKVSAYMTEEGILILSGIIQDDAEMVKQYVLDNGYKIMEEKCLLGWVSYLLQSA